MMLSVHREPPIITLARRRPDSMLVATLEWVDWYNNRRLLEPIGNMPPAKAEARHYAQNKAPALAA